MSVRTASGRPTAPVRIRLLLPTVRTASDGPPYRVIGGRLSRMDSRFRGNDISGASAVIPAAFSPREGRGGIHCLCDEVCGAIVLTEHGCVSSPVIGCFVMVCPAGTGSWSVGWTRTGVACGDPENNEPGSDEPMRGGPAP